MIDSIRVVLLLAVIGVVGCGPTPRHSDDTNDDDVAIDARPPACTWGEKRACYSGAPGTQGVGPCAGGTQTCEGSGDWGPCLDEVVPRAEVCANTKDDNCNGMVDEDADADGDGFRTCGGDCCDALSDGCGDPKLVNPGAFEAASNSVDDDCDGTVDNSVAAACDSNMTSNSSTALDYAKAMELCQTTTTTDSKWGVISARFALPSGTGAPNANQRSIRTAFGGTSVTAGNSFAVLSTGNAAAVGQTNPPYFAFQNGNPIGTTSGMPSDWLAAHNNTLPNAPGCPAPVGTTARDPIMLELTIRTPTNARSFSLSTNFLSAEYPEWVCSPFNDFFVVLLDSTWNGQPANPADKNLATYTSPINQIYPVGVNLAHGNTGLFSVCKNGSTGCAGGAVPGTISTCTSTTPLIGTGMDVVNPAGAPGYCGTNNLSGGATGWLVTSGNVKGGEIITLRIALWDTSDHSLDSVSIIDNFRWSVETSTPGTTIF